MQLNKIAAIMSKLYQLAVPEHKCQDFSTIIFNSKTGKSHTDAFIIQIFSFIM